MDFFASHLLFIFCAVVGSTEKGDAVKMFAVVTKMSNRNVDVDNMIGRDSIVPGSLVLSKNFRSMFH